MPEGWFAMSTIRSAFLVIALLLTPLFIGVVEGAAQPRFASPYGFSHDIPYFAINLLPEDTVDVGIWVEMLRREPATTIRYHGEFGRIIVQTSVTNSGPSFSVALETLTAEAIWGECVDGLIQANEQISQIDNDGKFSIVLSERQGNQMRVSRLIAFFTITTLALSRSERRRLSRLRTFWIHPCRPYHLSA